MSKGVRNEKLKELIKRLEGLISYCKSMRAASLYDGIYYFDKVRVISELQEAIDFTWSIRVVDR